MRPTLVATVLTGIVLMMSTSSCGAKTATAKMAANPPPGCVILNNLSERIVSGSRSNIGGDFPSIGDSATYLDLLYDSKGTRIAIVYGELSVLYKKSNNDLMEWAHETIVFAGGNVEAQGIFDVTQAGNDHVWEYAPAIGTTGKYRGKLGKRWFQVIKLGSKLNARIDLCPASSPSG